MNNTINTKLKIIQHNVLQWKNRRHELFNIYRHIDPDIILINSHCLPNQTPIKILGYKIYQKNTLQSTTEQIHHYTNTKPINIYLHEQALKIWDTLESMEHITYNTLKHNHSCINRYHTNFPSSLYMIEQQVMPIYK